MFTIYLYNKLNYGSIIFRTCMQTHQNINKYQPVSVVNSSDSNVVGLNILVLVLFVTNLSVCVWARRQPTYPSTATKLTPLLRGGNKQQNVSSTGGVSKI